MTANIDVFDFFSGCGGTSCGFKQAGLSIKMGLDIDADAAATYKANFPEAEFIQKDIKALPAEAISEIIGERKSKLLFSGCAPCQPFSKQNRHAKEDDIRITLLEEFGRFINYWKPEYVFIENVPGMQRQAAKSETFRKFLKLLTSLGYQYDVKLIEAQWYGVPQKRTRLVLLASLSGEIFLPEPSHGFGKSAYSTVRDWISDLPSLNCGEIDASDPDHFAAELSDLNLRRIRATPEGGGREHWPKELLLDCHKDFKGHSDVYARLSWDKPASGLTTRCISYSNGRFGHPEQDRALSLREAACLQTFPRTFTFRGLKQSKARQVGNAVPPLVAQAVGSKIKQHI